MTMLAEVVDAVVGGGTHRDTHALEMLAPNGTTIATLTVRNDEDGFAEVIAFDRRPLDRHVCATLSVAMRKWLWLNCREVICPGVSWRRDHRVCDHAGRAILKSSLRWSLTSRG